MEHKEELLMEKSFKEGEAMSAASSSSLFTHPLSLLHQVVHGCVGYLASLCRSLQNLKPGAPAVVLKQVQADDNDVTNSTTTVASSEEHVVVQISTTAVATPQRPLIREGNDEKGGAHHSTGF